MINNVFLWNRRYCKSLFNNWLVFHTVSQCSTQTTQLLLLNRSPKLCVAWGSSRNKLKYLLGDARTYLHWIPGMNPPEQPWFVPYLKLVEFLVKRQIDLNTKKLLRLSTDEIDAEICEDMMQAASLFPYWEEMPIYQLTEDLGRDSHKPKMTAQLLAL